MVLSFENVFIRIDLGLNQILYLCGIARFTLKVATVRTVEASALQTYRQCLKHRGWREQLTRSPQMDKKDRKGKTAYVSADH